MIRLFSMSMTLFLILTSCSSQPKVLAYQATDVPPTSTVTIEVSNTPELQTQQSSPTTTPSPTIITVIPVTPTPELTATPAEKWNPPGDLIAPILLYHHVAESNPSLRYYVPPAEFTKQMQLLKVKGYNTISINKLHETVVDGASIPLRPIVITFDDGAIDVYQNAFPIMKKLGFTGTFYIPGKYLNGEGFVTTEMVKEMISSGWEIGSHGMSHVDLTKSVSNSEELLGSRILLEEKLSTPITTFSYPFGVMDENIINKVKNAGYQNAVGLGFYAEHNINSQYFLSRIEIKHSTTLIDFEKKITTLIMVDGSLKSYLDIQ